MVNDAAHKFPYYVDSRATTPAGLDVTLVRAAAESAWGKWNAVTCASPKTESKGLSLGTVPNPVDVFDKYSVMPVWLLSQDDQDFVDIIGADGVIAALTVPVSYAGVLITCDTYLNGATKGWSLDAVTPANKYDVETVLLHEFGHCLGLAHNGTADNVMWPQVYAGDHKRELGSVDKSALCERNPASAAAGAPCNADGTCGASPTLKCLDQPTTQGLTMKLCSNGCKVGTGAGCVLPLTCQAASDFTSAGFDGACKLPGTSTTQVGKACTGAAACTSALAICRGVPAETTRASGYPYWGDGYCTQSCESGQPDCPAGSTCVVDDQGRQRCLADCRLGLADCRAGYACAPTSEGAGVCWPKCYANADCECYGNTCTPGAYACRTCDGVCIPSGKSTAQLGDSCGSGVDCGAGQVCQALSTSNPAKFCTEPCARGCGTCSASSTCSPEVGGELLCLKNCTGPGTCPSGLQCRDTALGKVCVGSCTHSSECSPTEVCVAGACVTPENDDGGCQVLCAPVDAGHPVTPGKHDAGVGGSGGTAGCGCAAGDGSVGLFAVLMLLGRRAWRRG